MIIEYYGMSNSRWYWRIKAANGKIIADGAENYVSKGNVLRAIDRFIFMSGARQFRIKEAK